MLAVQAGNAAAATQAVGMMIYCFGRGVGTNATPFSDFVARPTGIEPVSEASETSILSIELQARSLPALDRRVCLVAAERGLRRRPCHCSMGTPL